jgi:hypothetical protein
MRRWLILLLAACGDSGGSDPCAAIDGACVKLTVRSKTVDEIDALELDILYGDRHATVTTSLGNGTAVALPVVTTVTLDITAPVYVGLVGAGKIGGAALGFGQGELEEIAPGEHAALEITLGPRSTCTLGGDYCGRNELAGNDGTLYRCTDGVPLARGRCQHGCVKGPEGADDFCAGGPVKCTNGSRYCGGNKVNGDPSSVYDCVMMMPANKMMCAKGCVIEPSPSNDHCR